MNIDLICQEKNFRVKASFVNCNRLDVIHATRVLRPELVERGTNTLCVDQKSTDRRSTCGKLIQDYGLEEGQTEGVACAQHLRPCAGTDQSQNGRGANDATSTNA